jgi:ribosomal-protein-alanine N-acetyltransferase
MSAEPKPPAPLVRPMQAADIAEVARLERIAYEYPWTEGIFRDCLRAGYDCTVLEGENGGVQGYCIMSLAVAEAHLLNLCIHPQRQGCGLGRDLLERAIERARILGGRHMFLEVRPSNKAALALYRSAGFYQIGERRRYYKSHEGREDAVVLSLKL